MSESTAREILTSFQMIAGKISEELDGAYRAVGILNSFSEAELVRHLVAAGMGQVAARTRAQRLIDASERMRNALNSLNVNAELVANRASIGMDELTSAQRR